MDTSCCDCRCVVWSYQADDCRGVDGRLVVVTVVVSCGVIRRMIGVVDGRQVVVMVVVSCGVIRRMIGVVDGH